MEKENVNHPSHYTQGKFETIKVIEEFTKDLEGIEAFCIGNAVKYLSRWPYKNGVEDLKKAIWYINKVVERKENEE